MPKRQKDLPKEKPQSSNVLVWSGVFFAIGVCLTMVVQLLIASHSKSITPNKPVTQAQADPPADVRTGQKGPWGLLEYSRILLRNYNGLTMDGSPHLKPTRWVFSNTTSDQLKGFLQACPFNETQKAALLDPSHWESAANGFALSPSDEIVLGLGKPARENLYSTLATNSDNFPQSSPFRFPQGLFNEFFAGIGLASDKLALLQNQVYTFEGYSCLCVDLPLQHALGTNDFDKLVKAFGTVRTWRVALRVTPNSDIEALVKYWGRGGHDRAIRPLLQSLARDPGSQPINVAFLLPEFARMRLYTYPDPVTDPLSIHEDCFYSALNFFSELPDADLADGEKATRELLTKYKPTDDKPALGDLLVLVNSESIAVHVCVYIADDFVFTKDGTGPFRPWVLMKISDMMADYANPNPPQLKHMRRKSDLTSLSPTLSESASLPN